MQKVTVESIVRLLLVNQSFKIVDNKNDKKYYYFSNDMLTDVEKHLLDKEVALLEFEDNIVIINI